MKTTTLRMSLTLLCLIGCSGSGGQATSASAPLDHQWTAYGQFLDGFVANGRVDYAALKTSRTALDSIVSVIGAADLTDASRDQRLAFYINTYNIITIRSVVDHYPTASIKNIDGVWSDMKWTVAGEKKTLDQIEHEILRPRFSEPRIHFAIVCASVGCPPIVARPFLAGSLDSQLSRAARDFITAPEYNNLASGSGTVEISALFEWFGEDFVQGFYTANTFPGLSEKENAVMSFAVQYVSDSLQNSLRSSELEIRYREYNWSLNERK